MRVRRHRRDGSGPEQSREPSTEALPDDPDRPDPFDGAAGDDGGDKPPAPGATGSEGRWSPRRLVPPLPLLILAAVIYLPLLRSRPGRVGADTKSYLTLDPSRLLARAPVMWDKHIGLGTVTHQNIGYLWPMGPYFWLTGTLGVPDWVAQRLWLGTILFAGGAGVWVLMRRVFDFDPWAATVASFIYAFTPFTLTLAARLSGLLLPYAGLPWMVVLTILAARRGGWRYPAMFALVVATIGSINATALVLAGIAPVLWFPYAIWVAKETTFRRAAGAFAKIGVLTVAANLWWIAGLAIQGSYGIDILHYTETAKTVAAASVSPEVLRGLGYWFFYGGDRLGPWIEPGSAYTQQLWLIAVTYAIPVICLAAAAMVRWKHRAYFVTLVAVGTFLAVGAFPWNHPTVTGRFWKDILEDKVLALRSTPRAVPVLVLGFAVLAGVGVAALARRAPRWAPPVALGMAALAVAGLPPLFTGDMVAPANLDRPEQVPAYWSDAAHYLDGQGDSTRVMEVPGIDFASYRWGNTVDPVLPGLMDRADVARELIPYGTPPSADLLIAVDRRIQENIADPAGLATEARMLNVGQFVLRSDVQYERYLSARPYVVAGLLAQAPGVGQPTPFGPPAPDSPLPDLPLKDALQLQADDGSARAPVLVYPVANPQPIVRVVDGSHPVVVAGSGEGLVDLAEAGLIDGSELLLYTGSYAGHPDQLQADAGSGATYVVTDSNRRRGDQWGIIHENNGFTEQPGETALVDTPTDNRLPVFGDAGDGTKTVALYPGGVSAEATSYGNPVSFTPEFRPAMAIDGDPRTAWTIGTNDDHGQRIQLSFTGPVTTDHAQLSQYVPTGANRHITDIDVRFDGGSPQRFTLGPDSLTTGGQRIDFPNRTFSTMSITVAGDDSGRDPTLLRPDRLTGLSPVGFSEISVDGKVGDEVVRLPTDLDSQASLDNPLTLVLTRARSDATNVSRSDEETALARQWTLPDARSFSVGGTVRLSARTSDVVLDQLLGTSGGVVATGSTRLAGAIDNRSSAAIDGNPDTRWTGALGANDNSLNYKMASPVTVSHLDLELYQDGRRSLPTAVVVSVAGHAPERVELGALPAPDGDGLIHVPVDLTQPVTGTDITVAFPDQAPDLTPEWHSGQPQSLPISVAELGIAGVRAPAGPAQFDSGCRNDLVTVDGQPIPVRITGSSAAAEARQPLTVALCGDGAAGLRLTSGDHVLRTAKGMDTGLDFDRLTLQSGQGGVAPASVEPLAPDTPSVPVTMGPQGAISYDLTVAPTAGGGPKWLVLGQSQSAGWEASVGGGKLAGSSLVNGFANGWRLPDSTGPLAVQLRWTPQSGVDKALLLSLLAVLACLAIIAWEPLVRRRRRAPVRSVQAEAEEPVPASTSTSDARLRHLAPDDSAPPLVPSLSALQPQGAPGGARPSGWWTALLTAGCGLVVTLVAGWGAGLITAGAVLVCCRRRSLRPVLALGAPLWLAFCGAWVLLRQAHSRPTAALEWPGELEIIHPAGWLAVAFLLGTLLVDHAWTRAEQHAGSAGRRNRNQPPAPGATPEAGMAADGEPGGPAEPAPKEPVGAGTNQNEG